MPRNAKIVIRNGTTTPSAVDFDIAEPAWDKTAGKLYIKDGAGSMVEIGPGGGGGLTHFVESEETASPNATVPVDALTATDAGYTNIDVALVAKGSGATLAQVPDGTTAGGNKRGARATDLQKFRTAATNVASGNNSVITGGSSNTSSANGSFVGGGNANTASAEYAGVACGSGSAASGARSFVGGGTSNVASSDYSFVGGGQTNEAKTNTHATCVGGTTNDATGQYSFVGGGSSNIASGTRSVIVGGNSNTASSTYSSVLSGFSNTSSSSYSVVIGGFSCRSDSNASIVSGRYATSRGIQTIRAHGNDSIASLIGNSQESVLILGTQTTDATPATLTSSQNIPSTSNQIVLPNNSAYFFKGSIIAGITGAGDTKAWTFEGAIKRGASAGTTAIVGSVVLNTIAEDAGASAWSVAVTADTTNGAIKVEVTGAAATTIRWVCKIETTEMTY